MLDAGIGVSKFNTFLSELNMPTLHASLVKRHECVVGKTLKALADESCAQAIEEEKALTVQEDLSRLLFKKITFNINY